MTRHLILKNASKSPKPAVITTPSTKRFRLEYPVGSASGESDIELVIPSDSAVTLRIVFCLPLRTDAEADLWDNFQARRVIDISSKSYACGCSPRSLTLVRSLVLLSLSLSPSPPLCRIKYSCTLRSERALSVSSRSKEQRRPAMTTSTRIVFTRISLRWTLEGDDDPRFPNSGKSKQGMPEKNEQND